MISQLLGTTISTITFISYVLLITLKYGVLPSISDSYYKHNSKLLFFLFMLGVGLPITLMATSGLMFFSGALFILCGCAPAFKRNTYSFEDEVHKIGALGGICLLLSYFAISHFYLPIILAISIGFPVYLLNPKNKTFWLEIIAFIILIVGLYGSI